MNSRVRLTLSSEDLNLILVSLSQMPYVQVHELIGRIQTEAGPQLVSATEAFGDSTPTEVPAIDD